MSFKERLLAFVLDHKWTVALVIAGIILFVLLMTINFWRTLLLCIILVACYFIGRLMDKGGWDMVKSFFDRILPK